MIGVTGQEERPIDRAWTVAGAVVPIRARASAEGRELVRSIRVMVNGRAVGPARVFNPPVAVAEVDVAVPLQEGRQKVVVEGENNQGRTRSEGFDVISLVPEAKTPTLFVLSVGLSGPFSSPRFPPIRYAQEDARELFEFAIKPGGSRKFQEVADLTPLVGTAATSQGLRDALKRLVSQAADPSVTVIVAMETHILMGGKDRFLLASDTGSIPTSANAPTIEEIGDSLAKIASAGSKVMLLIDSVHPGSPRECVQGLDAWVRSLSRRNVIVFVASTDGPSRRLDSQGHGAFAQGILDTFRTRAQSRSWIDAGQPLSLDDFQDTVCGRVLELSERKQFASCYIPETISPAMAIFEPDRPPLMAGKK